MSAKTKIVVLRMKELVYTGIFIGLALFLLLLFIFMFRTKKDETSLLSDPASAPASLLASEKEGIKNTEQQYIPGVYSTPIVLGNQYANVEVTVNTDRIASIRLVPLSESIETMYPLMQPAMESLSSQILEKQILDEIEYPAGSQYTSRALMNAIETALKKAEINTEKQS